MIRIKIYEMNKRDFLKLTSSTMFTSALLPSSSLANIGDNLSQHLLQTAKKIAHNTAKELIILYPEGAIDNILPVAREFTDYTSINIKFQSTPINDIKTSIALNKMSGQYKFDIALPATFSLPDLVEMDAIMDITDFAKKYEVKDFTPSLYTHGDTYKKCKYGYQTDGDVYIMFYNNLLLGNNDYIKEFEDKFGEKLDIPKNWNHIDRLIQFFHRPDENIYGGNLFRTYDYIVWEWWARYHATGDSVFDPDFNPNINNDAAIQALEDMISVSQYLKYETISDGLFENWEAFAKGNIAVNIGWGGTQKYLNQEASQVKNHLLFSPTPHFSYFNWGWNYVVSSASPSPELSYIFCLFATLPEQSTKAVRAQKGFFDPFRSEHYNDKKIEQAYTKPFLETHKKAMMQAKPDFYIQDHTQYIKALKDNIMYAFEGEISAQEALKLTAREWIHITQSIGKSSQKEQWRSLYK